MSANEQLISIHQSVLLAESIEALNVSQHGGVYLDCTLGGGGHAEAILQSHPSAVLFALDRDASAIERSKGKLAGFGDRFEVAQGSFADLLHLYSPKRFDGILADLGTSMDQLKGVRGFSFNDDAPLDMRMDQSQPLSANEVVNTYDEKALKKVLQVGGCGSEAGTVARAIVRARPIVTAKALAEIISETVPPWKRHESTHPATVPFQAIRIEVNDELSQIKALLDAVPSLINSGGRCAIITFHSLEDRIVTNTMRRWESGGERSSLSRIAPQEPSLGRLLSKKPVVAGDAELSRNPAARSARLRAFEFNAEVACQQY